MNNKFSKILICLITMLIGLTACEKDKYFIIEETQESKGKISFSKMLIKLENQETEVKASLDVATFYVEILKNEEVIEAGYYKDLSEVFTLAPGDYTVRVTSEKESPVAAWENPWYKGEETVTVKANEITEVATIVCKRANVHVTIIFDENLKEVMSADAKVNVLVGENGSLDFYRDETRSGYFAYVAGSNTLVAVFSGLIEGVEENSSRSYVDVEPGKHYKITYTLHSAGGELPDEIGTIFPGLMVDAKVESDGISYNVDDTDAYLDDNLRPSQDNGKDPVEPDKNLPTLETTSDSDAEFGKNNIVDGFSIVKIHALSEAEGGFSKFMVTINSELLNPDELKEVGLSQNLDLINPGTNRQGLIDLGLLTEGQEVKGSKEQTLDISGFMKLLVLLGSGSHDFVITIGDANGDVTKTLTLVIR